MVLGLATLVSPGLAQYWANKASVTRCPTTVTVMVLLRLILIVAIACLIVSGKNDELLIDY